MFYGVHLHLQSGEQSRLALPHLQFKQFPVQKHLMSSRHDLETSGIVTQTGTHDCDTLVHPKFCGDGITICVCVLMIQIPAWYTARLTCWSSASLVGGSLSIALFLWQKSSLLVSFMQVKGLVLSYRITVSLSNFRKWSSSRSSSWKGWQARYRNVSVTSL